VRYEEQFREQYSGDKGEWVVKPIDPNRPHRYVEKDIGRKGTCVICDRRKVSDWHDDAAKQHTVEFRDAEQDAEYRKPKR